MTPEKVVMMHPLTAYIDHHNGISQFVATSVVLSHDKKEAVTYFINLAAQLIELDNYNCPTSVLGGLSLIPSLFDQIYATLGKKTTDRFKSIESVLSPAGNFSVLRRQQVGCAVPALAVLLSDLARMGEVSSEASDLPGLTEKFSILANILHTYFQPRSSSTYPLLPSILSSGETTETNPGLISLLTALPSLSHKLLEEEEKRIMANITHSQSSL